MPKHIPLTYKNLDVFSFKNIAEFEKWMAKNYTQTDGFWLRFYKKDSGVVSITYKETVDIILCWGWVDGLINKYDEKSFVVRYTPRRAKSIWSKINVAKVERLIAEHRMQPAGLIHVEAAKKDGRWDAAYEPPSKMKVPDEFMKLLSKHPTALEKFNTLKKSEIYSIAFKLHTTKDINKRSTKMKNIVDKLL